MQININLFLALIFQGSTIWNIQSMIFVELSIAWYWNINNVKLQFAGYTYGTVYVNHELKRIICSIDDIAT